MLLLGERKGYVQVVFGKRAVIAGVLFGLNEQTLERKSFGD